MTDNRALWELVKSGDMAKLLSLARLTLHFAYVWNDRNFVTPKGLAKDMAIDAGLFTLDEAKDFIERIESILERPVVVGGWLPIESAPKVMGDRILCVKDCGEGSLSSVSIVFWLDDGHWHLESSPGKTLENYGYRATHWMSLPAPPETNESMVRGKS